MKKNPISYVFLLMLPFFISWTACTKKEPGTGAAAASGRSPEDVVKEFIQVSAHPKSVEDRRTLQDLCAGELKRAFLRMSDEEFRLSYLTPQVKLQGIKVLDQSIQNDTAKLHYQVSIENTMGTDLTQELNEREVELTLSQGSWYIEFIRMKGTDKLAFTKGMIF